MLKTLDYTSGRPIIVDVVEDDKSEPYANLVEEMKNRHIKSSKKLNMIIDNIFSDDVCEIKSCYTNH